MSIKSILCIFSGSPSELNALESTLTIAKIHNAHIRFLHLATDAQTFGGLCGEGFAVSSTLIEALEQENKARLERARHYVNSFTSEHHIPLNHYTPSTHYPSAEFIHITGNVSSAISQYGWLSDLIIIGQNESPPYDVISPALFATGRPVVVVPAMHENIIKKWDTQTAAFAWNNSFQSARALFNALPLLKEVNSLHVLTVRSPKTHIDAETENMLVEYLHMHSISSHVTVTDRRHQSTGEALLAKARELGSRLLIMGAYGHSMFQEMVLGGVTEYMLENADIPLLLSH